ncbi:hypothetical protein DXC40_01975 [Anaerotruncus colihominis]|uniref:Uncharacterized protein n=1 Tax=Anaerotruncus colihominis TaxID=169435 RepID=A0A3E3IS40_9FIRM|nr:hypothetical protein DXC40_01975 [Anaerotruncus colihominis]
MQSAFARRLKGELFTKAAPPYTNRRLSVARKLCFVPYQSLFGYFLCVIITRQSAFVKHKF